MGIDSSRFSIAAELQSTAPSQSASASDTRQQVDNASPMQTAAQTIAASVKPQVTASSVGTSKGFFGPDGPSFRDALDAINPLNHIPIVSDVFASATGHEPSTASKLVGGAMFGPVGFLASLASVVFEDAAGGKTPVNAVYAAITGDSDTLTAQADTGTTPTQVAQVDTAVEPVDATELASLETATGSTDDAVATAHTRADAALAAAPESTGNPVLDLYGASNASAHASYKKAQLLPYLRDVNQTKVM